MDIPHLDRNTIDELKEIMQEDFHVLLEAYLMDATERMDSIQSAVSSGDCNELRESAHSFKGSSSNIGAVRLASITEVVEHLARENELDEARPKVEHIREEYEVVRDLIEAELQQLH